MHLPTSNQLAKELWDLAYPGEKYQNSALSDVYNAAKSAGEKRLVEFMTKRLSVDKKTLPKWYETVINQP